ncbi:hypothetical protein EA872_24685 [Salmonella enterica]|nr:hypothetical protein [Salmonella enterica]
MAVPETSRPWPGEVDLSGFRGAALNQSRSAGGVYTGFYVGMSTGIRKVLHVAGEKCSDRASVLMPAAKI